MTLKFESFWAAKSDEHFWIKHFFRNKYKNYRPMTMIWDKWSTKITLKCGDRFEKRKKTYWKWTTLFYWFRMKFICSLNKHNASRYGATIISFLKTVCFGFCQNQIAVNSFQQLDHFLCKKMNDDKHRWKYMMTTLMILIQIFKQSLWNLSFQNAVRILFRIVHTPKFDVDIRIRTVDTQKW